jgi:hypothetical protein
VEDALKRKGLRSAGAEEALGRRQHSLEAAAQDQSNSVNPRAVSQRTEGERVGETVEVEIDFVRTEGGEADGRGKRTRGLGTELQSIRQRFSLNKCAVLRDQPLPRPSSTQSPTLARLTSVANIKN